MATITIDGVSKRHAGQYVLHDVSLEVPEGTYLGLIGPGGAGKSLLLKIVAGLVEPDAGEVWVRGQNIHELNATELADLRFHFGMLFQNYALFDYMTVAENIAFPLRQEGELSDSAIDDRVGAILDEIGLPEAADQFPNELSGGMKKRVSFARSVIRRPPLLLYDDPSAGLDPVTSSKIFRLLRKLRDEYDSTAITVGHDLRGIEAISDRVAMLDEGELRFDGTIEEIESCSDERVRTFWQGRDVEMLSR